MNKLNSTQLYFKKHNFLICAGLIFLAALGLRFYNIDGLSAWYDEIGSLSLYNAQNDFRTALSNSHLDLFPPVYNMLLWAQFNVFGNSIESGRQLSAFFGLGSVVLFLALGTTYANRVVGLALMLITATHPYFIYYSREMRPYSALLFFGLLSYYLLILCERKKSPLVAIIWAFSLALSFNTHVIAITIVIHQTLRIYFDSRFSYVRSQKKTLALLALLSAYPSYLVYLASQQAFSNNTWAWIGSISLFERLKAAASVWMGYSGLTYVLLSIIIGIAVLYIFNTHLARKLHYKNWLFFDSLIILSVGFSLDLLCYRHLSDKYYMPVFALFLIGLLGLIDSEVFSKKNKKILLTLSCMFFLANAVYRFNWYPMNENYKDLIVKAAATAPAKNVVFLSPHRIGLAAYAKSIVPTLSIIEGSADLTDALIITDKIEFLKQEYPEQASRMHLADPNHFRLWCNF